MARLKCSVPKDARRRGHFLLVVLAPPLWRVALLQALVIVSSFEKLFCVGLTNVLLGPMTPINEQMDTAAAS